jgi:hypothetical protein
MPETNPVFLLNSNSNPPEAIDDDYYCVMLENPITYQSQHLFFKSKYDAVNTYDRLKNTLHGIFEVYLYHTHEIPQNDQIEGIE